ncbi:trigger factor [Candidatus Nitrosacidococcus tergens]|uniref:Trigger factor n=1 Tax=Candidatus Nitrosacidococcus tergens TaxID=553981 RepID=A0A7G1QAC8_9GAMM|nr:trigger factor [Candidatus Nitrosacidococcus tergens]CAB1275957.1 Trigger factor [Candidatus Nitrosacidococcus tergens]
MEVIVENIGNLKRQLTVKLPSENIESQVRTRIQAMAPRAKINGFRPGKIPYKVLERHYGAAVHKEIIDHLVQSSFQDAIKQESLQLASTPKIDFPQLASEDQPFQYIATFEVLPQIEEVNLSGIKVKRPAVQITKDDIHQVINKLQYQYVQWNPVDRPAQKEDGVTITYRGTIDGQSFPSGERENFFAILGKHTMLEDFEDHLLGTQKDQQLTFKITFPEDYHNQDLASKVAQFTVDVLSVAEPNLPEIDESFAKKLGISDGSVETLRQEVKKSMNLSLERGIHARVRDQVIDLLFANHPMEVLPESLVKNEAESLRKRAKENLSKKGINDQKISLESSQFEEQARKRIILGIILEAIVEKADIKIDQEKIKEKVAELSANYEDPEGFARWVFSNRAQLSEIRGSIIEMEAINWVLSQIEVSDEPMGFQEVVY